MGITLSICTLSEKREAMLRDDPSLVWALDAKVPGFLGIGKAWDALRVAVKPFDTDDLLEKLFAGTLGKSFGEAGSFGKPRIVSTDELTTLAEALDEVPSRFMQDRVNILRGTEVHGDFFKIDEDLEEGEDDPDMLAQLESLETGFERVRNLVKSAVARGETLLVVVR